MHCKLCQADLNHCHETLVVHYDGTINCFDIDCRSFEISHEWTISCTDAEWPCDCNRVGFSQPLAA